MSRPLYSSLAVILPAERRGDDVEERQVSRIIAVFLYVRVLVVPWCVVPALVVVVNVIVGLLVRRVWLFPAAAAAYACSPTWCFREHPAEGLAGAARARHHGGHNGYWRTDGEINVRLLESRVTFHSHVSMGVFTSPSRWPPSPNTEAPECAREKEVSGGRRHGRDAGVGGTCQRLREESTEVVLPGTPAKPNYRRLRHPAATHLPA